MKRCTLWRLLCGGYLFVNCDYVSASEGGADMSPACVKRINRMVEYIIYILNKRSTNGSVQLMAIGAPAKVCVNNVASRLKANGRSVRFMICGQPARLARIICNQHCVGIIPSYSVFNPQSKRFIQSAAA